MTQTPMKIIATALLMILASANTLAQEVAPDHQELVRRARTGNGVAILQLGNQGDPANIPILRSFLRDSNLGPSQGPALKRALAKLGDRESLQYFACRIKTDRIGEIEDLIRDDLAYIGGEFSVTAYRQLLDSDNRFKAQIAELMKLRNGDSWPPFPSLLAILNLQGQVPGSSIPMFTRLDVQRDPKASEKFESDWRNWIDGHKADLVKMKPTSQGINWNTNACPG